MPRKIFFSIRSHLKVVVDRDVSGEIRKKYKLWKIKPLADKIKLLFVFRATAHSLKNFVCATREGLIPDFGINQGKDTLLEDCDVNLGLKTAAVIRLTKSLKPGTKVFVDRFFTTIPLLEYLPIKGIVCTGSIMKSQMPAAVHLTAEKVIEKIPEVLQNKFINDGEVNFIQWFDQKPILLASTALGQHPTDNCKRWSKKDSKYRLVSRPCIVKCYNDYSMGGIDLIDRMMSYYRMSARTKKWTVKTIFHLIDLAIANSWIL
ncbi:hypothetical protein JTB14_005336 [Gonioctena quinquepunctata]|nr:hypothetical protein JTB14_005336 [Gonioctena quinquepunctata]